MRSSRWLRMLAGAALAGWVSLASPELAYADASVAEQLFQQGLAAMKEDDYATACDAFAGSNRADPSPGTQINLALCFERQKKWASAWAWYRSAAGLAHQRRQPERASLAEEAANRLQPQLHYIVISVREPLEDLSVKRDGVELPIAVGGKEVPLPIDPGEHTIEVTARGKKPWSTAVRIADESGTDRVDVPTLEDEPVVEASGVGDPMPDRPLVAANDGSTQRLIGVLVGGAGVVTGLAAGGVFLLAHSEAGRRDEAYDNARREPANAEAHNRAGESHHRAAEDNQLIALGLAGGAAALVGVGAVIYFTAPKGNAEAAPKVAPVLAPGYAGFAIGGAF